MAVVSRLFSKETFGYVAMWLIVAALLAGGFYLGNVLALYYLVIVFLVLVIANMAIVINGNSSVVLVSLSFSAWFFIGLFLGVVVHRFS